MKIVFKYLKRITVSFFLLYAYNVIIEPLNLIIPINPITLISVSILGIPALLCLIVINVCMF